MVKKTKVIVALTSILATSIASAQITRVSVTSSGGQLTPYSQAYGISGNGRYVTFTTTSPELNGGTNLKNQAYVYDYDTGNVTRISESTNGGAANSYSFAAGITYDGSRAVFLSQATDIVTGISSSKKNVYVRDIENGTSSVASITASGTIGNGQSPWAAISDDVNIVAFETASTNLAPSDTNGVNDIFLKNMATGELTLISRTSSAEANDQSIHPSISSNGRVVAFLSDASNLVPNDTNATTDAFIYDVDTGTLQRVSVSSSGAESNGTTTGVSISANGRYVAFTSAGTNLVAGDTEGYVDVFVRDLLTNTTVRASATSTGSGFAGLNRAPTISGDGRYVVFESESSAQRQVTGSDFDIYRKDMETGEVRQIDIDLDNKSFYTSYWPLIDNAGNRIAFSSFMSNLVSNDTNGQVDAFLADLDSLVCQ